MLSDRDLALVRRTYARQVIFAGGVANPALETAYAAVPREAFVGPGPWPIWRWPGGYRTTPDADPIYLYADVLVGLVPERGLNNGQPSGHAAWLDAIGIQRGGHVVHIGAGVGYYSAIMAELAGPAGRVTAIEFDPGLAQRARANLADRPNVAVVQGDGALVDFDPADVIYVNAGATRPADLWLDRLKDGGRLLLPLTTDRNFPDASALQGAVFRIDRRGEDFLARWVSHIAVFPCEGMRDAASEQALAEALKTPRWHEVTRLVRGAPPPVEACWLRAPDWSLTYG
ncbi:MAG: methyltransferase domain-containing protein [Phenylobacterium sp.]|nr:MAG: methyltransferase domain-containing protein [Phenylobacterium sp.]